MVRTTLLVSAFISSMAFAAVGNSVLTGNVVDAATKKPVEDVVVTVTAPTLQGEEIAVTDKAGFYRIPQLPGGTYLMRFEKSSYKLLTRPGVVVALDRTVRLNVEFQPDSVTLDTVVVVGKPPTVDTASAQQGISIGKDFIKNLAVVTPNGTGTQNFEDLARTAPQVSSETYGFGINGGTAGENLLVVDGAQVNDPVFGVLNAGNGAGGPQMPTAFLEEVNVITGGYMPEFGRASGGAIVAQTKSGQNETHGSIYGNYWPGALTANAKSIVDEGSVFQFNSKRWNTGDFGAEVGGSIVKDKLWYYVGVNSSINRNVNTRTTAPFALVDANGQAVTNPNDGVDFARDADGRLQRSTIRDVKQTFTDRRSTFVLGKLTYNIDSGQSLALGFNANAQGATTPVFNAAADSRFKRVESGTNTFSTTLQYRGGFLNKTLLVDVNASWFRLQTNISTDDGSTAGSTTGQGGVSSFIFRRTIPHPITDFESIPAPLQSICETRGAQPRTEIDYRGGTRIVSACPVTGGGGTYTIGGPGFLENATSDRFQFRANTSYLLQAAGHHIFKGGIDLETSTFQSVKSYSGGVQYRESPSGNTFAAFRSYSYSSAPDELTVIPKVVSTPRQFSTGLFIQDAWSIMDVITLQAGLRYETQQLFASDGTLGISLNNMLMPRVGLIYDFTQSGRSKLYANYARYMNNLPLRIADRALTGEYQGQYVLGRADGPCNPLSVGVRQAQIDCGVIENGRVLSADPLTVSPRFARVGNGRTLVDPGLQPFTKDEVSAGAEYEIIPDLRLGASFTHNFLINIVEDLSNDEANTYFIGNPNQRIGSAFPKPIRNYYGATAVATKNFSDGWSLQASYTWSSLYGNYSGAVQTDTDQLDPGISADFDLKSLLPNRTGFLANDRTHFIKAYLAKSFEVSDTFSFLLSLSYEGRSGLPINYLASHPIYGADNAYVLPRGSGGRTPFTNSLNARAGLTYKFSKTNSIGFSADVFNFINAQTAVAVDQSISTSDLLPIVATAGQNGARDLCIEGTGACTLKVKKVDDNGAIVDADASDINVNFKQPTAFQQPLSVQFSVKLTF
jgi:hypothetical protein